MDVWISRCFVSEAEDEDDQVYDFLLSALVRHWFEKQLGKLLILIECGTATGFMFLAIYSLDYEFFEN